MLNTTRGKLVQFISLSLMLTALLLQGCGGSSGDASALAAGASDTPILGIIRLGFRVCFPRYPTDFRVADGAALLEPLHYTN